MGEFGRGGLSHHDGAGAKKIAHHPGILFRHVVTIDPASHRRGLARRGREILDGDRHPVKRTQRRALHDCAFRSLGLLKRLLGIGEAETVELGIDFLDAFQAVGDHLDRRHLPRGDVSGKRDGRGVAKVEVRHGLGLRS